MARTEIRGGQILDSSVSLTADITGTLPVGNGGSGTTTLTGLVVGNTTSPFTAVAAPTGAVVGTTDAQAVSGKTLSDTYMGEVFDANTTQRDTILTAGKDFAAVDNIEIAAATSLEIPATSTLEVLAYSRLPSPSTGGNVLRSDGTNWVSGPGMKLLEVRAIARTVENFTIVNGSVTTINAATVDTVTFNVGDRILIVNALAASGAGTYPGASGNMTTGSSQPGNGVYVVTATGASISVTRAADFSGDVDPQGLVVYVHEGQFGRGSMWGVITPSANLPFSYGNDNICFGVIIGTGVTIDNPQFTGSVAISQSLYMYNGSPTIFGTSNNASNQTVTIPAGVDGMNFNVQALITLTSAYTLTNNTSAQKLFNSPTNGSLTVPVGTFFFECVFGVTGLATAAHTISFGFGGTAVITRQMWVAETMCSTALGTPAASVWSQQTGTAAIIASQTTNNATMALIRGKLVVGTGGTLIPQIVQNTASAAAIVSNDSFFRIGIVGSNTVQSVGTWT